MNALAFVVLAVWFAGALVRIYRQARFFQIEEYMNLRYLHWSLSVRARWLPSRPLVAWLISAVLAVVFSEGGVALPFLASVAGAVAGAISPGRGGDQEAFPCDWPRQALAGRRNARGGRGRDYVGAGGRVGTAFGGPHRRDWTGGGGRTRSGAAVGGSVVAGARQPAYDAG